tara:strand:- start:1182 stop:2285 length:1104 start_codon:yes stop_codon:yes gene_type:complete
MNSWKETELSDVLDYVQPTQYIVSNTNYNNNYETPVLTPGKSFILGYTSETTGVYTDVPVIIFDDFTTAFKYVDFPFKVKSSAMKILKANSGEYDIKFIYYLMKTLNFEAKEHKRYWISKYSKQNVLIPPLNQQKKIAAILDAADAYRQKTKALIDKYDQLSQSLFLEMFGDIRQFPRKALKECTSFIDYRGKSPNKSESGIPLLTAKNVKPGYISPEPREFIPEDDYVSWMVRGFPKTGDVLFTTEAPLGQAAILPKYDKVAIAQRLICLQPDESLNPTFLLHTILSLYFQHELNKRSTGSTAKGIRSKELAKIEIPIPPIKTQSDFARHIYSIDEQKKYVDDNYKKSENLFNSLLQKAFKGELTT